MVSYSTYPVLATLLVSPSNLMANSETTNNHRFSMYLEDGDKTDSNNSDSSHFYNRSMSTTIRTTTCSCSSNQNDSFLANAHIMIDQMINKTTMLSKIRHRATHSNEAVWASFTLSGLMMLLVVGVLHSRMWNDRTFISYSESQPIKFEQYNPKSEILVKDLIRSRGRNLLSIFTRKRKGNPSSVLQMETFMAGKGDAVDSCHQALIESSDEDFYLETDSDSEEETVFKINSKTGLWEGLEKGETDEMTMSLLGSRKRRNRNRTSTSSSESRFCLLNSTVSRDLVRLSDSEVDEGTQLIQVG